MDKIEAQVLAWLTAGEEGAADIVDLPWKVEEIEKDVYVAEHSSIPFTLVVMFTERYVKLAVPTNLRVNEFDLNDRLFIYETLMMLNDKINLMKYSVGGDDNQVRIRVDLDKSSLGKEEFNNALSSLVIGLLVGVSALGLEEEFLQRVLTRIVDMLVYRIEQGSTEEELMYFLTVEVGMGEEEASELLEAVLKSMEEEIEEDIEELENNEE